MTSQLQTIPLPASKAFLIWPLAVVSAYTSAPTNEYVLPSFLSLYFEKTGRIFRRGDSSNDQPARVTDEPAMKLVSICKTYCSSHEIAALLPLSITIAA